MVYACYLCTSKNERFGITPPASGTLNRSTAWNTSAGPSLLYDLGRLSFEFGGQLRQENLISVPSLFSTSIDSVHLPSIDLDFSYVVIGVYDKTCHLGVGITRFLSSSDRAHRESGSVRRCGRETGITGLDHPWPISSNTSSRN